MACNNAKIIRFVVQIKNPQVCPPGLQAAWIPQLTGYVGNGIILTGITKVGGLSLGEEGEVEVPDWDVTAIIPDGKRKLTNLSIQARVDQNMQAGVIGDSASFFAHWFNNRHAINFDVDVIITSKAWDALYYYKYVGTAVRSFSQEDQELGAAKLGLIDVNLSPTNVQLFDCKNQIIVDSVTPGSGGVPIVQFCA